MDVREKQCQVPGQRVVRHQPQLSGDISFLRVGENGSHVFRQVPALGFGTAHLLSDKVDDRVETEACGPKVQLSVCVLIFAVNLRVWLAVEALGADHQDEVALADLSAVPGHAAFLRHTQRVPQVQAHLGSRKKQKGVKQKLVTCLTPTQSQINPCFGL